MRDLLPRRPPIGLLAERDFRWFWSADLVSKIGDTTTFLALPLTAIVVLDSSPLEVGLIGVAQLVAAIAFGLPAGAWVDRSGRRLTIMVAADLGRAASLATVPLAYAAGILTLGQLLVVAGRERGALRILRRRLERLRAAPRRSSELGRGQRETGSWALGG